VLSDLETTKDFAINNVLRTDYQEIEDAALYNLKLKGKNFRSAILFTLARAIHANNQAVLEAGQGHPITDFVNTDQYDKVVALAACIEIAHNASLLQDDIIDKADSRRSVEAAHKVYGPSTSVFASDFMVSRASRMLT
jgi:geranylgeranyl pyrophosphate synthase